MASTSCEGGMKTSDEFLNIRNKCNNEMHALE